MPVVGDRSGGAGRHRVREAGGFVDEAERRVPVEIAVDRGEVRKGRRLREELEGQAVTGIIGVEQVAREGEQAPPIL